MELDVVDVDSVYGVELVDSKDDDVLSCGCPLVVVCVLEVDVPIVVV